MRGSLRATDCLCAWCLHICNAGLRLLLSRCPLFYGYSIFFFSRTILCGVLCRSEVAAPVSLSNCHKKTAVCNPDESQPAGSERETGLKPATLCLEGRCSIDWAIPARKSLVGGEGFEPTKPKQQIYSLSHLTTLETSQTNKLCSRLRMQISHNKSTYTRLAFQKMRLPYVNRHTICIRQAERDGLILKTITPMRITKCAWA